VPKKWTLTDVVRALTCGQADDVRCDGKYTDDYAWDNAENFGKGPTSALHLARRIAERPSGWRVYAKDNGRISVGCHHFDYNSFIYTGAVS